jgi:hypothetical protein
MNVGNPKKKKAAVNHRILASQPQRKRKAASHLDLSHFTEEEMDLWFVFEWLTSDPAPFEERLPQVQSVECLLDAAHRYRNSLGSPGETLSRFRLNTLLLAYQGEWRPYVSNKVGAMVLAFAPPRNLSQDNQRAYNAVQQLDLLVTHIRRCAWKECRDWFFVSKKQTKKRWCSNACGQRLWDSNPINKEGKRLSNKARYDQLTRGLPKRKRKRT